MNQLADLRMQACAQRQLVIVQPTQRSLGERDQRRSPSRLRHALDDESGARTQVGALRALSVTRSVGARVDRLTDIAGAKEGACQAELQLSADTDIRSSAAGSVKRRPPEGHRITEGQSRLRLPGSASRHLNGTASSVLGRCSGGPVHRQRRQPLVDVG